MTGSERERVVRLLQEHLDQAELPWEAGSRDGEVVVTLPGGEEAEDRGLAAGG